MALYKYDKYVEQTNSAEFDSEYRPGSSTPYSGIYRCMGCGREIVSEDAKPLPPQNHHQHSYGQGEIRWKLIVYADHKEK